MGFRPFFLFFLIFFFFSQLGCFQAQKRLWRLNRGTSRRGRICLRKMESLKKLKRKGGGRGRGAYSRSISSPSWTETTGSQAPKQPKTWSEGGLAFGPTFGGPSLGTETESRSGKAPPIMGPGPTRGDSRGPQTRRPRGQHGPTVKETRSCCVSGPCGREVGPLPHT